MFTGELVGQEEVPAPLSFSVASDYFLLVLVSINNQGLGVFANKILKSTGPMAEKGQ